MQHLITRAANTSNILNVERFWHVISGVILGGRILTQHSLRFNVLLMCTSPHCSQRATISCIWLILHHKVTGALYVDGLILASSFVPRVCCLWCIQHPVTCRRSHLFYVAFLRGLVCLPTISWTCTSRCEETLWLTFKSNQRSYSTVQ